ncbi:Methyltransferase domain-containing protein [Desulfomicrobium apsheronum]|uniref:Methyltransferase domain-containing protein n=1 Tax=Desulfomicrobium apsheronum TaxID=52560 RepID=A0A1I3S759_9BACT|nr:class I SAM-dependent methyltransferase [Desulfomicrobium apsheronum]SFJ54508.1 Methyltransferase domain-containing protein [Desulfomicrobium apsheronum]
MGNPKTETIRLAETYAAKGDPDGWFEEFYDRAGGDISRVYWADLEPNPLLLDWVDAHPTPAGRRAVVVGCGLGDDAEALRERGYSVVGFDISPSAIDMCRKRYPDSPVEYVVADLFDLPASWLRGFDLVYECNTIQILTGANRLRALSAIAELVAPDGEVIVSCRSRASDDHSQTFPIALDRHEIDGFVREGLTETHFLAYDDHQDPPVPHFFAVYRRLA